MFSLSNSIQLQVYTGFSLITSKSGGFTIQCFEMSRRVMDISLDYG